MQKRYTIEVSGLVLWGGLASAGVAELLARKHARVCGVSVDLYCHTSTRSEWMGAYGPAGELALPVAL